ncbi:MAG: COG1361 S-layer family protein [Candidatus Hodarchaeales archaeon]
MNTKANVLTISILLLIIGVMARTEIIMAQNEKLELISVSWPNSAIPGASSVGLQVNLLNVNNFIIQGINGKLNVTFPFSDPSDGDEYLVAQGIATSTYFNVSQYTVLSGEPFQLTYSLNVDEFALKGEYSVSLNVSYFDRNNLTEFYQIFDFELSVFNRVPIIEWSRPTTSTIYIEPEESVFFEASGFDEDNDSLTYEWLSDNVTKSTSNNYLFQASNEVPKIYRVELRISDGSDTVTRAWQVQVDIVPQTQYTINSQYLEAGSINTLKFSIQNNVWNNSVSCSFAVPQPLVIQGNASKTFENITEGSRLNFSIDIYVPNSAIGQTTMGQLTISYSDKYSSSHTETYSIGLIAQGRLKVTLYDVAISSTTVTRGGTLSVSGTLLNTGNIPALFANVSVTSEDVASNSFTYLGEIEVDSPLPFTLLTTINSSAPVGTNTLTLKIFYQDDIFNVYSIVVQFQIEIIEGVGTTTSENTGPDFLSGVLSSSFTLMLILATIGLTSYVLYKNYYKKK